MRTLLSGLMGAALAASFAIGSAIPLNAAPVFVPQAEQMRADVVKARDPWRKSWRAERRDNRWARRHAWRDRYYYRGDPYYAYRPRHYYPRYYYPRYYRPGVTLEFNL